MTETEWEASEWPERLLEHLADRISDRKLRLFASASCRHEWGSLTDERSRTAVEMAERFADGLATKAELEHVAQTASSAMADQKDPHCGAADAVYHCVCPTVDTRYVILALARNSMHEAEWESGQMRAYAQKGSELAPFLKDIFGNPFRPASIDAVWLTWNNGTVVKLARSIYEDRRWDLLPILGDALEDALCDNADILEHCRGPGPHVRGCWVVDLILGKE